MFPIHQTMTLNEHTEQTGTSPSASGPAGALFEGQVGAHYLLTMLAEADPRGMPGVLIDRVELQRAGEGHPLDDVIVRGITPTGELAILEVQVKRTITFSPSDHVFKSVVVQLAQAFRTLDLMHQRHQFAVATARTSFKITGPYQDVLRWARELDSSDVFFGRINRKGVGNNDMRTFIETVRLHLQGADCPGDDETVWQILRRFQILTFDYDAPGSQSIELALVRARNLLDPTEANRVNAFWKVLTETSIRVAASGGDLNRIKLLDEITSVDGFRLLGSSRNRVPRETLAEAARLAAADLRRRIAGITLARTAQLDAVRAARDHGRYVEIRGGPGVGKSGILGMFVDQVLNEGRAIVLTQERTTSGGWLAFKSELQIEGGLESFLFDLASDGGAVLFVDSLDFFDDPGKRATVTDLVRGAVAIPGFQVIVTARTDFDRDEPNWLPLDALEKLGCARPVVIEELGGDEIEELKAAAPNLRALLADDHPASAVARNLFRLSRLLEVQGSTDQLRSEVDLLERWWTTADGPYANQRIRKRLLADLTDAILAGGDRLATRMESSVVDALISSGTLRELGLDSLMFRHDVLRDWGVAARLHDNPEKIDQLPLNRAVPPSLARGIELGARFALERSDDGERWKKYLNLASRDGAHASWRRWSLLAILRSELTFTLLDRASASLMENDGVLLRELIRTTLAVESRPLVEMLAECGAKTEGIPAGIYRPSNRSWATLVRWLLARRASLPLCTLPDVVELFQSFSMAMFFLDTITPEMAAVLADWLEEIEDALEQHPFAGNPLPFASAFKNQDLQKLATDIRQTFFLMASRVPERAQSYLRGMLGRRNTDNTVRSIMKFRGTLANAAPAELVDVTLAGLIPKEKRERSRTTRNRAFTYLDIDFLPTSPAQGPFLELLNAAPVHGLTLIRRLVGHAITQLGGRAPDGFTLELPTGSRFFPWECSYFWSRRADGCYAVASGLLALEAWAHARIERGDVPEQVIADVLGPEGSPAAFLLVAVDILISHWPKTMVNSIPFLGSPELLSVDRTRQIHDDNMPEMNFGGWGAIGPKEPTGSSRLADLKKRPSRRYGLERLLVPFAIFEPTDRSALHAQLAASSLRLGPPEPDDTFASPRFMVRHAMNLIDPANWPFVEGDSRRVYVAPLAEAQHIEELQKTRSKQTMNFEIDAAIQNVLEDSAKSSPELAECAVAYAQYLLTESDAQEDALCSRTNAIVSAAMILARDGSDALLDQHVGWARNVFALAFASTDDITISRIRDGIRFNPVATAALGLIHLWRRHGRQDDRDGLLELAGRDDPHAAQGFDLTIIREIEPRLAPALLRCALSAQIQPTHEWDAPNETKKAGQAQHSKRVAAAIQAEVAWLNGVGREPTWPTFPSWMIPVRGHLRFERGDGAAGAVKSVPDMRPSEQLCTQSAALWLRQLARDSEVADLDWIVGFVEAYLDWTAMANGAGFELNAEIKDRMGDWNGVFLPLLARSFSRLAPDEAAAHVVRMVNVPDKSVFDIVTELAPAIDRVYFNGLGLDVGTALKLRVLLADRLMATAGWRWELDRSEFNVEMQIGPAIATLFFNNYNGFGSASCYLHAKGIDKVDAFFPQLGRLIEEGPVPFCSLLVMNLLEVSPRVEHLQFFLSSVITWLQRQPTNTQLWVDARLGARIAKWLEGILLIDTMLYLSSHPLRPQVDNVLARLVQVGIAQAHRLEAMIATKKNN